MPTRVLETSQKNIALANAQFCIWVFVLVEDWTDRNLNEPQCTYVCPTSETPCIEDTVDLCLSFTPAGMSEHDCLPVASENKSDHFRSNSGQLHLL